VAPRGHQQRTFKTVPIGGKPVEITLPRVRKRGRDGKVTTLVAISDEVRKKSP
jgi:hypothetical protein